MKSKLNIKTKKNETDICFLTDSDSELHLKIYQNPETVLNHLENAIYWHSMGYTTYKSKEIQFLLRHSPELEDSLPYLNLIDRHLEKDFYNCSSSLSHFITFYKSPKLFNNLSSKKIKFLQLAGVIELHEKHNKLINQSLDNYRFLDLLMIDPYNFINQNLNNNSYLNILMNDPKKNDSIKKNYLKKSIIPLTRKSIKVNTTIKKNDIDRIIENLEKELKLRKEEKEIYVRSPWVDSELKRREDRKRIAQWFRDGGTYDLF